MPGWHNPKNHTCIAARERSHCDPGPRHLPGRLPGFRLSHQIEPAEGFAQASIEYLPRSIQANVQSAFIIVGCRKRQGQHKAVPLASRLALHNRLLHAPTPRPPGPSKIGPQKKRGTWEWIWSRVRSRMVSDVPFSPPSPTNIAEEATRATA